MLNKCSSVTYHGCFSHSTTSHNRFFSYSICSHGIFKAHGSFLIQYLLMAVFSFYIVSWQFYHSICSHSWFVIQYVLVAVFHIQSFLMAVVLSDIVAVFSFGIFSWQFDHSLFDHGRFLIQYLCMAVFLSHVSPAWMMSVSLFNDFAIVRSTCCGLTHFRIFQYFALSYAFCPMSTDTNLWNIKNILMSLTFLESVFISNYLVSLRFGR